MARESIPRDTVGVKVYFRQNHASLDSLFRDNGSRLDSFSRRLVLWKVTLSMSNPVA